MGQLHPQVGQGQQQAEVTRSGREPASGKEFAPSSGIPPGCDVCKRRIALEMLKMIPFDNEPLAWILLPQSRHPIQGAGVVIC